MNVEVNHDGTIRVLFDAHMTKLTRLWIHIFKVRDKSRINT